MVKDLCPLAAGEAYEIVNRLQEQNNEEILLPASFWLYGSVANVFNRRPIVLCINTCKSA